MPATGCAVMMRSSYNNGGLLGVFQVQCIWAKFTHLIWIYWLLMWYFVFLSNFGICYKCTVSYRYLLLRIAIHIGAPVSAVYRCIVSALDPTSHKHRLQQTIWFEDLIHNDTATILDIIFFNTLRPIQNGCHFPDDIFKCIFINENVWIYIKISLKCVPKVRINNIPALVQIMAWHHPGDKPLSEPMMVNLPTHTCVAWPQWVNKILTKDTS